MKDSLPKLRPDVDVMPSPVPGQPGLLLRDPFLYTNDILVIPPPWVALLQCLDGEHSVLDAQSLLTRLSGGQVVARSDLEQFVAILTQSGFIESDELDRLKQQRHDEFRRASVREPTHAGSAYPGDATAIESRFSSEQLFRSRDSKTASPIAVAAPHVSPEGGFASYRAAYDLPRLVKPTTFVILGTSHYGAPERFGTSAKPFQTPLGRAEVDHDALSDFVSRAGEAVIEEDYCHRAEHSIEFQVLFLQYHFDQPFRILPILCGPFVESLTTGKPPESRDGNRRVFDALAELHVRRDDLVWILGVDMAHIGTRYGHRDPARAGEGVMVQVAEHDRRRLDRICGGDSEGFFDLVHPGGDELNWCGYSPMYTFLRSVGSAVKLKGEVRSYEQWNIDQGSVVTFGALHFSAG
jgi:hypothetical protein